MEIRPRRSFDRRTRTFLRRMTANLVPDLVAACDQPGPCSLEVRPLSGAKGPSDAKDPRAGLDTLVELSIRRSQARAEVLGFLARRSPAYATLIAEGTGLHLNTVLGALRGVEERYSEELSLLSLGLIEEVDPGTAAPGSISRFYAITDQGRSAVEALTDGPVGQDPSRT